MKEMPSLNMSVQRRKVAILPLDLPCSGPVTHSEEILTTGKSHGKKPDTFSLNDYFATLIKFQPDATACRYLFTAKSLYMFRVSQYPSSGVLKTVTAASGVGHNIGTATSIQRGLIGREVALPIL